MSENDKQTGRVTHPKPKANGTQHGATTDPKEMDPNKPTFHLVSPLMMQETIEQLRKRPMEKCERLVLQLRSTQLIQPTGEERK